MQQRLTTSLAILLVVAVGLACSLLRPTRPLTWHLMLEVDAAAADRAAAVQQTITVIQSRLHAVGVPNFKVLAQGEPVNGRILVSLPDVPDRERLARLITAGGKLELVAVIGPPSPSPVQVFSSQEDAIASLGGKLPANRRVLPYVERDEATARDQSSERSHRWVVVEAPAIVDGSDLRDASAVPSRSGSDDYQIRFSLKAKGAQKFADWTGTNINNYLGVVLNDEVKSIAYIKSQISDSGEIAGRFTKLSAEDLALVLRSGALPAPVKIIEEGADKH